MYSDAGYRALDTAGRIGWRWWIVAPPRRSPSICSPLPPP